MARTAGFLFLLNGFLVKALPPITRMRLGMYVQYRWLLYALTLRDLRTRYKGSVLGFMWTFLNPLLLMMVYTLVFGYFLQLNTKDYPVFIMSGVLPWIWFSTAVTQGSASILEGATYVGRTIFPTSVLPVVAVSSGLVNFLLSLPLLGIMLLIYGVPAGPEWLYLPLLLLIQAILLIGLTSLLSALSVFYRDIQHMLGHVLTLTFFTMPIMYPMTTVPEKYRAIVALNPLATLFHSYQQIFYFHQTPDLRALGFILIGSIALYALGQFVFNRNSESFAEYL